MIWAGLVVGCVTCYVIKLAGLSVPSSVLNKPLVQNVASLLPVGLLAALAALQTFSTGHHLTIDARVVGVAVAGVVVALRAPFLVTVGLAALATALVRAFS